MVKNPAVGAGDKGSIPDGEDPPCYGATKSEAMTTEPAPQHPGPIAPEPRHCTSGARALPQTATDTLPKKREEPLRLMQLSHFCSGF